MRDAARFPAAPPACAVLALAAAFLAASCSRFRAERVGADESDERAMTITDEWVQRDTEKVVDDIVADMGAHEGFRRWRATLGRLPTIFVGEVQNMTGEAYFPVSEINDELLSRLSASGGFVLVDAAAREALLREVTYQNDGMVDPKTALHIGRQAGANAMVFGNVHMQPRRRGGRAIKQYSVNLRITDIERGVEVLRVRTSLSKYSDRNRLGW